VILTGEGAFGAFAASDSVLGGGEQLLPLFVSLDYFVGSPEFRRQGMTGFYALLLKILLVILLGFVEFCGRGDFGDDRSAEAAGFFKALL